MDDVRYTRIIHFRLCCNLYLLYVLTCHTHSLTHYWWIKMCTTFIVVGIASSGSWSTPPGCVGNACTYRAEWSFDVFTDRITFTITAQQAQTLWTGIAFAPDQKMVSTKQSSDDQSGLIIICCRFIVQEEEEEDSAKTYVRCEGAHSL